MTRPVGISPDFDRIVALPVRHLSEEQAEKDIELMTPLLTTPLGRAEGARLILYQGTALREIHEQRGGYIQLGVGHGKTLVFWLAPYVLDAQRPLMIVPAALRDDTRALFRQYSRHWVSPKPPPTVMGYSEFFRKEQVDLFERLRPDVVMLDEAHKSTNQDGTFAVRLDRWKIESGCSVVCGTGTGTRFSLKDFSHNITWALQDKAPLPLDFDTLDSWCDALDEKLKKKGNPFAQNKKRPSVGVLVNLADRCGIPAPEFDSDLARARWALQQRLRCTPGVIISNESSCNQPLTIELVYAPEDEAINAAFEEFREHNSGPDGAYYNDPIVLYTKERQLGCGVVQTWDPDPPEEWRKALRARNKYCAHIISHTRAAHQAARTRGLKNIAHPCDSPDAVESHPKYGQHEAILEWKRISKLVPELKTRPTWVSASVIQAAAKYARENNALIWYEFEEVGRAIAAAAGIVLYGPGGLDDRGRHVRNDAGDKSIALSIDANLEGRNLQDRWCDNYIIGAPQSGRELEQLIGRTARFGQNHPIYICLLVTSGLTVEAWRTTLREGKFVRETQGQDQAVMKAEIIEGKAPSQALRWRVRDKSKKTQPKTESTFRKKVSNGIQSL